MTGAGRARGRERGMALAVAIFALIVVGLLVAAAFFAGNLEQRTGRNAVFASEAADAAESGTASVFASWDPALNGLAVGDSASVPISAPLGARITVMPSVVRLNDELYLVRSLGQRTDGTGRVLTERTVATVARLVTPVAAAGAAVTVTRPIAFAGGGFTVSGNDAAPDGWAGCAPGADQAGIRSAAATGAAVRDTARIAGVPRQVARDPTVTSAVFGSFGSRTFDQLARAASVVLASAIVAGGPAPAVKAGTLGRCDIADRMNWGEPRRSGAGQVPACARYFPVVYREGSLVLSRGGRGQGLLLVRGNLEIGGGFEWAGLIVATGGILVTGVGNRIEGAVLAQGALPGFQSGIGGSTSIRYSSCAIRAALAAAASAEPLTQRSWIQVY